MALQLSSMLPPMVVSIGRIAPVLQLLSNTCVQTFDTVA